MDDRELDARLTKIENGIQYIIKNLMMDLDDLSENTDNGKRHFKPKREE
jgi:hypothetical protein